MLKDTVGGSEGELLDLLTARGILRKTAYRRIAAGVNPEGVSPETVARLTRIADSIYTIADETQIFRDQLEQMGFLSYEIERIMREHRAAAEKVIAIRLIRGSSDVPINEQLDVLTRQTLLEGACDLLLTCNGGPDYAVRNATMLELRSQQAYERERASETVENSVAVEL